MSATTPETGPGSLRFVGTATTLIRFGGFTILTDPNFLHRGQRAYLGYGLTSARLTEPALSPAELPPLDAIVLSHLHGDHFDRVARRALDRDLPVFTTPPAARRLQRWRFSQAVGLRTWRSMTLAKDGRTLRITAVPGRHALGPARHLLPPVMGTVLEYGDRNGEPDLRIYLSGDTLVFDGLGQIRNEFPDLDLAVLHLGGTTLPGGLMVTMDGRQGVELMRLVEPRRAVPVHYNDYGVFKSPLEDFQRAVDAAGVAGKVTYLAHGESVDLVTG
jgi:L-ascorbate metabolism protein UlaG (beta-lactamase superfamily)